MPTLPAPDRSAPRRACRMVVKGTVQGVGFRPFVYRIAHANALNGTVANSPAGVLIEVSGDPAAVDRFIDQLSTQAPPLATIDRLLVEELPCPGPAESFRILASERNCATEALVPADVTICSDCERELFDPQDRRYHYPLNNCTNCGPRYTIIRDLPYDRSATAMAPFDLCASCRQDYEDPGNRRFHAEATGCPACGPTLRLTTATGKIVATDAPLQRIATQIRQGQIVAIQGVGGFHIVCDAGNSASVDLLRQRKQRPDKPFAVMVRNLEMARTCGVIDTHSEALLCSPERPVVLVPRRRGVCAAVTGDLDRIGLFLPYSPLHLLLFQYLDCPLVATSANIADEPIITDAELLRQRLGAVVDGVLAFDREIINGCDDSVVTSTGGVTLMLRRARGYAPAALKLPAALSQRVLAVGAGMKNTIALGFGHQAILSPHIGDLDGLAAEDYFRATIATFTRLYDFTPELIVCDKHPGYFSSRWAAAQGIPLMAVQHHYAHALAGMTACGIGFDHDVLAFCWDGTGYGDDGTLWGGEVLECSWHGYRRIFHLARIPLPGGEAAIREPRRVALSLLLEHYGDAALSLANPCIASFSARELELLRTMQRKQLNVPLSSSVGRLFDAAASLLGICQKMTFEGQSGMLMEKYYDSSLKLCYRFAIDGEQINFSACLAALAEERDPVRGVTGFINMLVELALHLVERCGRTEALLVGGVFQNSRLVEALYRAARRRGIHLYVPSRVPVNDGSIALGQVAAALTLPHKGMVP